MGETKHEKFQRIASNRTNRIIDQLRLLGNCSNRSNYEYTDEEVRRVFNAIEAELKAQKARFSASAKPERFKL